MRPSEVMSEWKPSDVELAAAWMEYKRSHHGPCGHPIEEAFDPESNPNDMRRRRFKYVADVVVCHACAAESEKREQIEQSGKTNRGVFVTSHREPLGGAKTK